MYHTFAVYILVFKDKDYIKIGMSGIGGTRIKQIEPDWGKIDWEKSRYSIVLGKIAHNVESALKVILSSYRIFEAGKTPIIIGGGHNNAFGIMKGFYEHYQKSINVLP